MPLTILPTAGQSLNVTRDPIRNNFQYIQTSFTTDHVDFNVANTGKHNQLTFPRQGAVPATAATDVKLYSLLSALSGETELFYRRQNNGVTYEFTSGIAASPGWTRLPSAILLKWGFDVMTGAGANIYTFPVAANIPAFTQIFTILVTTAYNFAGDGNGFARLNSFAAPWTNFTVYGSQRTTTTAAAVGFSYLAIGI